MELTIEIRPKPGKLHELYQTLQALLPTMRNEKHCRDCRFSLNGEVFFLMSDWETEASVGSYLRSTSGIALLGAIDVLSEGAAVKTGRDARWEGIEALRRMRSRIALSVAVFFVATVAAYAGEIGHFSPGVPTIRDLAVPGPGAYVLVYNYGYMTSRLNDANGNEITSAKSGGVLGPGTTPDVSVDISAYALAPTLIWVAPKKVLGANYGLYFSPTFSNTSLNAALSSASGIGRSAGAGQFNIGDIFVQPVWLGWGGKHYDVSYGYGFYIPSGKYSTTTGTLPDGSSVTAEAADNIGCGFWTNQNQGALYLYPWSDKRMAIQNALTWEIHRRKRNFDLTAGQNLTWNWGVSQYLPLKKSKSVLLEVGPTGYSSWQVSDDTGTDALNPAVHDRLHAAGVQVGITSLEPMWTLNFHWFHEFSAVDRFQGTAVGLDFALRF